MSHLLYLRSFLSVYRHNSISRAADALHLTQPAVSRHIKVLEGRLGCKLFERLPRGLASTPAAHELERQVGAHLDALEAVVGISGGKSEGLAGIIHVGSTSGFTKLLLAGLAPLSQYGVRLDLRSAPPPALVKALAEQELDLAVTPARIPHRAIDYDLLYEGSLILVCAPRWRERLPKSAAPKGLPLIEIQGPMPCLPASGVPHSDRFPTSPRRSSRTTKRRLMPPPQEPAWPSSPSAFALTCCKRVS
jgi:Transcriptional regulator